MNDKSDYLNLIAQTLEQCEDVTRYDSGKDKEAWTLAHDFTDLEESCRVFIDQLLPKLKNQNLSGSEIKEILMDIGEEFRHILYHIRDSNFYKYLE